MPFFVCGVFTIPLVVCRGPGVSYFGCMGALKMSFFILGSLKNSILLNGSTFFWYGRGKNVGMVGRIWSIFYTRLSNLGHFWYGGHLLANLGQHFGYSCMKRSKRKKMYMGLKNAIFCW